MLGFLKRGNPAARRPKAGAPIRADGALRKSVPARIAVFDGVTMGTTYQVRVALRADLDEAALSAAIFEAVDAVDRQMSTWKPASDLSRFNAAPVGDWVSVPRDLAHVVGTGLAISKASQGAFDMTVGAAVNAWGFGPVLDPVPDAGTGARTGAGTGAGTGAEMSAAPPDSRFGAVAPGPQDVPKDAPVGVWRDLEARMDPPALIKRAPMYVDLSGIAKGYGVDRICEVLLDRGLGDFLVSIDGETRACGRKPGVEGRWRVAIDRPDAAADGDRSAAGSAAGNAVDAWDVLEPEDRALATSGDYRRFFERDGTRYAHTIDPATGQAVQGGAASVTVMMRDCMTADAWATALLVMGPQRGVAIAQARNIAALFLFRERDGFRQVATGGILPSGPGATWDGGVVA
ncbi:FAD:protein FMN transferase [Brevirhabdus sp.]|uniref:FAD:protein FMN transferase n=1 Tax=Brevirhabdus sp. TaxID=2004514 RepID=UPI004058E5FE